MRVLCSRRIAITGGLNDIICSAVETDSTQIIYGVNFAARSNFL